MSEKQVIVTLEDGLGRVQTSIATSLSAPQLMDKIMEIDEQQATIRKLQEENEELRKKNKELQGVNDDLVRWAGEIAKIKLRKELENEREKIL